MLIVGLTGGIASGKSTVSKLFIQAGIPVLDADALVHRLQQPGSQANALIAATLGKEMLFPDGNLDRQRLGRLIFQDPDSKTKLNEIMHPLVEEQILVGIKNAISCGEALLVLDIPLLYESGFDRFADKVVVVYSEAAIQLQRLMARDGIDEAYAKNKVASQLPLAKKKSKADYVLDNSKDIGHLTRQFERLLPLLKK